MNYDGAKVFSATKYADRRMFDSIITNWLRENEDKKIVGKTVRQSSDSEYHCLTVILFWKD